MCAQHHMHDVVAQGFFCLQSRVRACVWRVKRPQQAAARARPGSLCCAVLSCGVRGTILLPPSSLYVVGPASHADSRSSADGSNFEQALQRAPCGVAGAGERMQGCARG